MKVSIPDRDSGEFQVQPLRTYTVFGFQGTIATTWYNYSISAIAFDKTP